MCRADVRNSEKYLEWLDEECNLLVDSKEEISKKIQAEKKNILDTAPRHGNVEACKRTIKWSHDC